MKLSSHYRKLLQHQTTLHTITQLSQLDASSIPKPVSSTVEKTPTPTVRNRPSNYTQPQTHFDSSMALTILVVLTALFFVAFFSMYICRRTAGGEIRRRRLGYTFSLRSESSKGLKPSTVRSLPLVPYGGDAKQGVADCVICLSEFEEGETVKMIPFCRHVFHPECIDTWLSSHMSCPLCRSTRMSAVGGV